MKILETNIYKLIKENISIILLFPTFLGGIWQVVELSSMSISFIRFFSVSQLVSDGILILYLLVFVYLGLQIVRYFFKNDFSIIYINDYDIETLKSIRNINIVLILITGILIYFLLFPTLEEIFKTHKLSQIVFLEVIPITLILCSLFLSCLFNVILSFKVKVLLQRNKSIYNFAKLILGVLIFYMLLKVFIFMITSFHRSFLLPDNIKNLEYVKCKIKQNNKLKLDPEILYFNDKYIFIELKMENFKQIEILSFESFLQNNACDSIKNTLK